MSRRVGIVPHLCRFSYGKPEPARGFRLSSHPITVWLFQFHQPGARDSGDRRCYQVLPTGIRSKPAHCWKALGPSLGTFYPVWGTRRFPPDMRQYFFAVSLSVRHPQQGAEAVFEIHAYRVDAQSSTRRSGSRPAFPGSMSCWYWPTPMAFGSIFTSSAMGPVTAGRWTPRSAGSHRYWKLFRGQGDWRNRRTPPPH